MMIRRQDSLLLLIDVQERLAPAIDAGEAAVARAALLARAAALLELPVVITEQYPQGLGPTVAPVRAAAPAATTIAKTSFAASGEPAVRAAVEAGGRRQLVIGGMETHVCVLQTALDLRDRGFEVAIVADAVGSRRPASRELGLARLRHAGCAIVDSEMVMFEWLERAGTAEFRALLPLIR
jgi:nicotinamidase-related amidase